MSNNNRQPQENLLIEGLKTVGVSLFLAFGIRAGVAQSFFIPSGSMEPTLEIDDHLMVDKLSYRFTSPQRGDIVVFRPPLAATAQCRLSPNHDLFIKRVIGLPSEKVEIKRGLVYINNRPLSEDYITAKPQYQSGSKIVPPNSYLVLGDNRNNSCDGHLWGFLSGDRIIGKAAVRFWPPNRINIFSR